MSAFGAYLRKLRLERGFGLRRFAETINMHASNLSNVEHGRIAPPQNAETLERIARALDVERGSEEWRRLHELAVEGRDALPPDVERFAAETPGIPLLLRTIEDRRLSRNELEALAEHIRSEYRGSEGGSERST